MHHINLLIRHSIRPTVLEIVKFPASKLRNRGSAMQGNSEHNMDLPDVARDRDQGLPLEPDPASVRILRPSVPNNDPDQKRDIHADVTFQASISRNHRLLARSHQG